tara:strand:+ start:1198 stop:1866 length:669 start_codon:yes stop_codon:yes gene_type:complete
MAFIKKIYAKSPDPDLERIARKQEFGQAQLARLAHVNQIGSETEDALQLVSDQITTSSSSGSIPAPFLQKTATQITYADGTILQGWKFTGGMLLIGSSVYSEAQGTIRIDSPDGGVTPAGFYIAYDNSGSVKCTDSSGGVGTEFDIINGFVSGADMVNTDLGPFTGQAVKSEYMGLFLDDSALTGSYVVTLEAVTGDAGTGTAEVFYQFEFLTYSTVTPLLS